MKVNEDLAYVAVALCGPGPALPHTCSRWSNQDQAVIALSLLFALLIAGCNGSAPSSSATDAPERPAIPGTVSATANAEPNVPRATPPPTARPEPPQVSSDEANHPIWAITDRMLSECSNALDWTRMSDSTELPAWIAPEGIGSFNDPIPMDLMSNTYTYLAIRYFYGAIWEAWEEPFPTPIPGLEEPLSPLGRYTLDMAIRIIDAHPEFVEAGPPRMDAWFWSAAIDLGIHRNNGRYQDPFGMLYYGQDPLPFEESVEDFEARSCLPYFLFYEMSSIVGEEPIRNGYLFYEVGGTDHFILDGELREVHFTFPPSP